MTTPVTAELYVDGAKVADGSAGEHDDEPTALSGLKVTWGRATTIDQISPSTASFEVLDKAGGDSFLELFYVGAMIDVHALGDVQAPPTLPINRDPSFEAAAVGSDPFGHYGWPGTSTVVDDRAATGAHSVRIAPGPPVASVAPNLYGAWIPPAPYDDLDPAAWDDLPRMQAGEEWAAAAAVQSPVAGSASITLYGFPSPRTSSADNHPYTLGATATGGTGAGEPLAWKTIRIPDRLVPAGAVGMWAGLLVRVELAAWNTIGPIIGGQPNPIPWTDAAGTWEDWANGYVDDVEVLAPSSADIVHRDVVVFSGRVTDLDAGFDEGFGGVVCSVIAQDFTADLANRDVGDEPWAAEPLSTRFARIVAASGIAVPYTIAPSLTSYVMTYMDVDRQQCWPLLADLATSVDGVLWSATHRITGPYLWLADPRTQAALYVLQLDSDTGLVELAPTAASDLAIELDACDVLLEPVVFRQSTADITTRVAVTWQEQTVDDDGKPSPTDRTETLIDPALEAARGTRRLSVSTLLTTQGDAATVAELLLARLHSQSWRVAGLTWRTDKTEMNPDQVARSLDLLDGTRRIAAPVLVTNLPDWAPSGASTLPLFLQGGQYEYVDGQWTLQLTTSSATSQGAAIPWQDVDPSWAWNEFDTSIEWTDLVGVAAA